MVDLSIAMLVHQRVASWILCWNFVDTILLGHFCDRWYGIYRFGDALGMGWKNFVPGLLKSNMEWHQQRTTNKELPLDLEGATVMAIYQL